MTGILALHGGGEFLDGDEPFLAAIVAAAVADRGAGTVTRPLRLVVVPTATARHRPELAAAHGVAALRATVDGLGRGLTADVAEVAVVDAATAHDPDHARRLRDADLIHLPGGDPDVIPALYPGTPAWAAMTDAWRDGAVLAGASAGAMALAAVTWTPTGIVAGLGLLPGVLVVPHADAESWPRMVARFGHQRPAGIGVLGLAERTGVLGRPGDAQPWRVIGPGEARWMRAGTATPVIVPGGETLRLD